jgi:two-component system, sensor histidine kinase and response regulator
MIESDLKNAAILIVDDQQSNIDILADLLEMLDYENITQTTSPLKALELLKEKHFDLLLLDLMMPELSGFELMEQLKGILPDNYFQPILVLTADASSETRKNALAAGASDFLTKPFDLTEVGLRIKNLLFTKFLFQQITDQNLFLEEKVKERTHRLEKINKELIEAKEKAEAGDRLKTSFIQNISHEVRTPLNGVLGFSDIMMDPDIDNEDKEMYKPLLQSSCDRLINTITDYMDISLIASGNMELRKKATDIAEIALDCSLKFGELCNTKNITFEHIPPTDEQNTTIETDPEFLRKIINHLLDNAVKFTSSGFVTFAWEIKGNQFIITVKDSGRGIDESAKSKIFNAFEQEETSLTRSHEGSGLGLAIIKGLVELLDGEISFESEQGQGTIFTVTMPTGIAGKEEVVQSNDTDHLQKPEHAPTFLIVEDDYANRLLLKTILKNLSSNILLAENGLEAVNLCKENQQISLVLMDLKMPVMDGFEATAIIKSIRPNLPVVALTAYAMSGDEQKARDAGCDEYLTKPVSKSKLFDLIGKITSL